MAFPAPSFPPSQSSKRANSAASIRTSTRGAPLSGRWGRGIRARRSRSRGDSSVRVWIVRRRYAARAADPRRASMMMTSSSVKTGEKRRCGRGMRSPSHYLGIAPMVSVYYPVGTSGRISSHVRRVSRGRVVSGGRCCYITAGSATWVPPFARTRNARARRGKINGRIHVPRGARSATCGRST